MFTWGSPLPLNRMIDTCENITFPQLRLRPVIIHETIMKLLQKDYLELVGGPVSQPTSGRVVSAAMACAAERRYWRTPETPRVERRKTGLTSGCYERKNIEQLNFITNDEISWFVFCTKVTSVSSEDYQMLPKHAKYTAGWLVSSFYAYSIIKLSVSL